MAIRVSLTASTGTAVPGAHRGAVCFAQRVHERLLKKAMPKDTGPCVVALVCGTSCKAHRGVKAPRGLIEPSRPAMRETTQDELGIKQNAPHENELPWCADWFLHGGTKRRVPLQLAAEKRQARLAPPRPGPLTMGTFCFWGSNGRIRNADDQSIINLGSLDVIGLMSGFPSLAQPNKADSQSVSKRFSAAKMLTLILEADAAYLTFIRERK